MNTHTHIHVDMKPLSVNAAWQGKRYKTTAYKCYEKELLLRLPALTLPAPPYRFSYEFGMSNMQADIDNPTKLYQDILSKKYGFNDCKIMELYIRKVKVAKGSEYLSVTIETFVEA